MKSSILALGFALSVSVLFVGTANAEIRCSKAVSKDACLTINNATPKPKQNRTLANNSCCYSCAACGGEMVQGICATCSVR
jgi:hypothetical protein